MITLNISLKELQAIQNPNIIDIRTVENYNNNHIPGAINIPYNTLLINSSKYLNKNEKYYIYCKHGKTSNSLCRILNSLGYQTHSITGGYEAWILSKYNEQ